jgi:outer membrane protein assembly factor BamA
MSPDESLLISNKIKITKSTDEVTRTSVDSRIVQDPNTAFLGMRWKLAFYNASKDSVNNRWNRWLRSLGEPPTVFDSSSISESIEHISSSLNSKGYFEPKISAEVKRKKTNNRKVKVKYFLVLNKPYIINQTTLTINDDSVALYLQNFDKETLLKKGIIYDVDVFDNERTRIASLLQTEGFMLFGKDKVTFIVDSAFGNHSMNIKVIVSPDNLQGEPKPHQKYYIRNITFLSDNYDKRDIKYDTLVYNENSFIYQDKQPIRPYILTQKTFLNKDDKYSLENIRKSYENLSELRILGYSKISFSRVEPSEQINEQAQTDCNITLTQNSRYGIAFDAEYTTTLGLQGPAINVSFLDRNIFKGGETFSLQLGATYEFQVSSKSPEGRSFTNVLELSAKARIDFPWLLASQKVSNLFKNYHPKSSLSLGYGFQMKELYWRYILNTAWGYSWRSGTKSHIFNPAEISIVKMLRTSDAFETQLNNTAINSRRLRYQYEDHFVLDLNYSFIYNEQVQGLPENYNYFRIRGETSGALLYLFSKAVKGKMNSNGQYEMLGLSFSQYVKLETEYKYCIFFSKNTSLIFRTMVGAGFAYGNSKVLPYEKSFFAGGSNTLRAWTLYHVGPGGWYDPNSAKMERLGDMIILLNAEQRFPIYSVLKGAVFLDAGNIWTLGKENTYVNGKFSKDFYKQLALNTGIGLRLDFNFFLIRVDLGIPMINPANPANPASDRKIWMWHKNGITWKDLVFNFGIGYPF